MPGSDTRETVDFSWRLQSGPPRIIMATVVGNYYRFRPLLTTIDGFETMMRALASSLFCSFTGAAYDSNRSRSDEAEFPVTSRNAGNLLGIFLGRRVAGCASVDALRPPNHSKNIKDQYERTFIRETLAPFARRIPPKGRPSALSERAGESSPKNILAKNSGIFQQRATREKTCALLTQRLAAAIAAPAGPQT
jgi:hypothetical protein